MPRCPLHVRAQADLQSASQRVPISPCPSAKGSFRRPRRRRGGLFHLFQYPNVYQVSIHVRSTLVTSTCTTAIPKTTIHARFRGLTILNRASIAASVGVVPRHTRASHLIIARRLLNNMVPNKTYNTTVGSSVFRKDKKYRRQTILLDRRDAFIQGLFLASCRERDFLGRN